MVIDLTSSSSQQAMHAREKVSAQRTNSGAAAPASPTPAKPVSRDTVELSDTAKVLKNADAKLANTPEVNAERVAELKAAIDNGSYQIDARRVAEKMTGLESLLD